MQDVEGFISGFRRFQKNWLGSDQTLFDSLRKGQRPKAILRVTEMQPRRDLGLTGWQAACLV